MNRIMVTSEFCDCAKKLVDRNMHRELNALRTVLIRLANDFDINEKKYRDHKLTDAEQHDIHISGELVVIYKKETDKHGDKIVVTLKLSTIVNHKGIGKNARRTDYKYREVSTNDLHDITSSIQIVSNYDKEFLYDYLETIADYACEYLDDGYLYLDEYLIEDNELHCFYNYVDYDTDELLDSVDFVIDLDTYTHGQFVDLNRYVHKFAKCLSEGFE